MVMVATQNILKNALLGLGPYYRRAFFFSFFINMLVLTPSWYMLEVYSRVVFSRNVLTLAMLTLLVVFLYVVMEALEWVRRRMMYDATLLLEGHLQRRIFHAAFAARLASFRFPVQRVFSDFRTLRECLSSSAFMSVADVPYVLIFVLAIFLIHTALGFLTVAGLLLQLLIAAVNQYRVRPRIEAANQCAIEAQAYFSGVGKKAEVVQAMGMLPGLQARWWKQQEAFLLHQAEASALAGKSTAGSKLLQVMQTSLVLGLGCYLVIEDALPTGPAGMIVASILAGRVYAPFIQVVGQWRALAGAASAYQRLAGLLDQFPLRERGMTLPAPGGDITVENLSYAVGEQGDSPAREPFLRNIQLHLRAGEVLLMIGPSGSGKSTLARLMAGLLAPGSGRVRFSGVDAFYWDKAELGQYLGYLPQAVELLDGTVAENIARFGEVDAAKVEAALTLLELHELIRSLPEGLETQIGSEGEFLSGGQRQLIGLARAIYGQPRIVVLDEPNANLDEAADAALQRMVSKLKQQGTTFVVISHLQSIKAIADRLLVLIDGQVVRYGRPDEVMAALQSARAIAEAKTAGGARVGQA